MGYKRNNIIVLYLCDMSENWAPHGTPETGLFQQREKDDELIGRWNPASFSTHFEPANVDWETSGFLGPCHF